MRCTECGERLKEGERDLCVGCFPDWEAAAQALAAAANEEAAREREAERAAFNREWNAMLRADSASDPGEYPW